jgi:small GTP-binding protein
MAEPAPAPPDEYDSGPEGAHSDEEVDPGTKCDVQYKICIMGDSGVGKTSLLLRFCNPRQSIKHTNTVPTIGISLLPKKIQHTGTPIEVLFQDTGGQERFAAVLKQYLRGADGLVLVFSLPLRESFDRIQDWLDVFRDAQPSDAKDPPIMLIGNKRDLEYSAELAGEAAELAKRMGCFFFMTSVPRGDQVYTAFYKFVGEVHQKAPRTQRRRTLVREASITAGRFSVPGQSTMILTNDEANATALARPRTGSIVQPAPKRLSTRGLPAPPSPLQRTTSSRGVDLAAEEEEEERKRQAVEIAAQQEEQRRALPATTQPAPYRDLMVLQADNEPVAEKPNNRCCIIQ